MRSAVCAVGMLLVFNGGAVTVHTWVDSGGVRHYADAPPADGQNSSEMQIEATPAGPGAGAGTDDDYYSIINQWNRTRAEKEAGAALQIQRDRNPDNSLAPPLAPPNYVEPLPRGLIYPGAMPYGFGYGDGYGRGNRHQGQPPPVEPRPPSAPLTARNPAKINTPGPVWPSLR